MQPLAHQKTSPRLLAVCGALLAVLLTSLPLTLRAQASGHSDWNAGRDLALNEKPDGGAQETADPNPTVPQWSYGYRTAIADTALTLYTAAEHVNLTQGDRRGLEGFIGAHNGRGDLEYGVTVYPAANPHLNDLADDEIFHYVNTLSPNGNNVIRWTCPAAGTYSYRVSWHDLDYGAGDGAAGYVVINGIQKFKGTWPDGKGQGAATTGTVTLNAGDVFDVLLNANSADSFYDSTGTRIVIVPGSTLPGVDVVVPGTANPWLAGQPNGATAVSGDAAPANSPALVTGLTIQAGADLTFSTSGQGTARGPGYGLLPADGDSSSQDHGPENGIGGIASVSYDGLLGVFLNDSTPVVGGPTPAALNYSGNGVPAGGKNFGTVAPALNQVFFIGDGKDANGGVQHITAPAGATRLYLGVFDIFGWYNNVGSLNVQVSVNTTTHPPDGSIAVPGTSNIWLAGAAPGTTASTGQDTLTNATPFQVPNLTLTPGKSITFTATGNVSNDPANPVTVGPDGGPYLGFALYKHNKENGIADLSAPVNSLIGVFLDDSTPNPATAPDGYNLALPPGTDYTLIGPSLRKPFFIGDGTNASGTVQKIIVPDGATRLFLGSLDPSDQENNVGSFFVKVNGGTTPPTNNAPVLVITDSTVSTATNGTGTSAIPGDLVTYGVSVRNTSNFDAANVKVVATLEGLKFKTVSDAGALNDAKNTVTWSLGTVAAHSSRVVTATAKVPGAFPPKISGFKLTVNPVTTDTANATLPAPLFLATAVASPYQVNVAYNSNVAPGETLRLTVTARNFSKDAISGLTASAQLPSGVKFLSITDDNGNALAIKPKAGVLTLPLPTLAAGGSTVFTVSLQINFDTASGSTLTLSGLKILIPPPLGPLEFSQPDITITLGTAPVAKPPSLAVGKFSTDASVLNAIIVTKPEAANALQALSGLPLKKDGAVDPTAVAKLALLLNPTLGSNSDADDPKAPAYSLGVATAKVPAPYLTYAVIATNNGTGDVSGVTVTDPLPDSCIYDPNAAQAAGNPLAPPYALVLVDGKPAKDASYALSADGRSLKLKVGKLPAGQSALLIYQVQVKATIAQAGSVLNAPNPTLTAKEVTAPITAGLDLQYVVTGPAHAFSEVTNPAGTVGAVAKFNVIYQNDGGKTAKDLKLLVKQPANALPFSARFLDNNLNVLTETPPGKFIEDALDAAGNKVFHLGKVKAREFGYVQISYTPVAGTKASAIKPVSTISPDSFSPATNAFDHNGPVARDAFHSRAGGTTGPVSGSSVGVFQPIDPRFAYFGVLQHTPFSVPSGQNYEVTFSAWNLSDKTTQAVTVFFPKLPDGVEFVSIKGVCAGQPGRPGGVASATAPYIDFSEVKPHTALGVTLTLRTRASLTGRTVIVGGAQVAPTLQDFVPVTANATQTYVLGASESRALLATQIVAAAVAQYGASPSSVVLAADKLSSDANVGMTTIVNSAAVSFQGGGVIIPIGPLNGVPQLVAAGAGNLIRNADNTLIAAGAGNLVAAGAGNLIAAGAGNLVNVNGLNALDSIKGLISQDGSGVVARNLANVFNGGGNNLISQDGAGVISRDAAGLATNDISKVVSNDGGSFVAGRSSLISQDGAGIVGNNSSRLVAAGAGNLVAAGAGNLVAAGAGNLVAAGAGNLTSRADHGSPQTRDFRPRALAAGRPASGSPANSVVIHPTDDGLVIVGGGKIGD